MSGFVPPLPNRGGIRQRTNSGSGLALLLQFIVGSWGKPNGLWDIGGDDSPRGAGFSHGSPVWCVVGDFKMWCVDWAATPFVRTHGGFQGARGQEGSFGGIRFLAMHEQKLNGMGKGLEQPAVPPRTVEQRRGTHFGFATQSAGKIPAVRAAINFEDRRLQSVLVSDNDRMRTLRSNGATSWGLGS